jgi:hypothetical protein
MTEGRPQKRKDSGVFLSRQPLTTWGSGGIITIVVEPKTAGYRKSDTATLPRRDA